MKLEPLAANIVVRLLVEPSKHDGLVQPVRLAQQPSMRAVVEAIGPDVRDARVGQRVLVSRLQGMEVAGVLVLPEAAVLAVLEEGE